MDLDKELSAYFSKLGKKGGSITKKKHGKAYYQKIARKGVEARWGKRKSTKGWRRLFSLTKYLNQAYNLDSYVRNNHYRRNSQKES